MKMKKLALPSKFTL